MGQRFLCSKVWLEVQGRHRTIATDSRQPRCGLVHFNLYFGTPRMEITFSEIEKEFKETFGYVRQDIAKILDDDLKLHYT